MATKYWISTSSTSFNTAANWSDTAAPANNDTLIFNSLGTANCSTNLGSAITGATLIVEKSYVGNIGVLSGSTATYLTLDGATLYLENNTGAGSPSGSPLIMVDTGTSNDGTAYVYDSCSQSSSTYYAPILLKGGSTGGGKFLTVYMQGGNVGLGALVGETANLKVYITKSSLAAIAPSLYLGHGVTLADLTAITGTINNQSDNAVTAMRIEGDAIFNQLGTANLTAASLYGNSILYHRGAGDIPTLNITGATIDRSQASKAITIGATAFNIGPGAKFKFNNGKASSITRSNKTLLAGTRVQDLTIELPAGEFF